MSTEVQRIIEAYCLGRLEGRASLKEEQSAGGTLRPIQPFESFRVAVVTSIDNAINLLQLAEASLKRSRGGRASDALSDVEAAVLELKKLKRGIAV